MLTFLYTNWNEERQRETDKERQTKRDRQRETDKERQTKSNRMADWMIMKHAKYNSLLLKYILFKD